MTAWLEMSRVHFGMKEGFGPVLVELILLNCRYLSVHRTKTGQRSMLSLISYHLARVFAGFAQLSIIYSQNDHPVTDS